MKGKKIISKVLAISLMACTLSMPISAQSKEKGTTDSKLVSPNEFTYNVNSEHVGAEIAKAFDGDRTTFWDSAWEQGDKGLGVKPIKVDVTFNTPKKIDKFVYTPRQDDNPNGMILEYTMTGINEDGQKVTLVENGSWENNHSDKHVNLTESDKLRSISLEIIKGSFSNTTSDTSATSAEFSFYETVKPATINKESMVLTEGQQGSLTLTNITGKNITWTSSNQEIATVSNDGSVTAKKEGTVTITATTENSETASCEVSVSALNAPEIPGKVLVFEDNFNGSELDMSKWNNWCVDLKESGPFRYGNSPEVAVHPDNAYVKDGSLRLLASKEETVFDGKTSTYRSAMVQTRDKFEEKYGYVEAMIKIPDVAGSNPAVWTMPKADEQNGGFIWGDDKNFGAEIDILERPHPEGAPEHSGLTNKYWITMHYDNYTYVNHNKYHVQPTIKDPYKWHKFGMEWTPDYINFILDGEVVATQKNDVPNMEEIFILSYGLGGWIGNIDDSALPAEMEVDYVRWYKNIEDVDKTV